MKRYIIFYLFGFTCHVTIICTEFFGLTDDTSKSMTSSDFYHILLRSAVVMVFITMYIYYSDYRAKKSEHNSKNS